MNARPWKVIIENRAGGPRSTLSFGDANNAHHRAASFAGRGLHLVAVLCRDEYGGVVNQERWVHHDDGLVEHQRWFGGHSGWWETADDTSESE